VKWQSTLIKRVLFQFPLTKRLIAVAKLWLLFSIPTASIIFWIRFIGDRVKLVIVISLFSAFSSHSLNCRQKPPPWRIKCAVHLLKESLKAEVYFRKRKPVLIWCPLRLDSGSAKKRKTLFAPSQTISLRKQIDQQSEVNGQHFCKCASSSQPTGAIHLQTCVNYWKI